MSAAHGFEADIVVTGENNQNWYAVYTRHHHEKCVAGNVSGKGIETFLPLYNVRSLWADRVKTIQKPLFPCYLFVRMALEGRLAVLQTAGVHFLVGTSDGPVPIPDHEIDAIQRAMMGRLRLEPCPFINVGDRVRITHGALEDIEGILIRKKSGYRVVLSIEMLQKSVAVEIPDCYIEPVRFGRVQIRTVPRQESARPAIGGRR